MERMSNDRSLKLEVILAAIDRATAPLKAVMGSSKSMSAAVSAARGELKSLELQNKRLEAFRQTARDVAVTGNAMQAAQAKVKELARQMAATDAPSKVLVRNFEAAKREAGQLKDRNQALTQQQQRLRTELQAAGVPLQGMATHQAALRRKIDDATSALRRQEAALKAQGERMQRLAAARAQYRNTIEMRDKAMTFGVGATAAGAAMGAPLINAVRDYSSFEDAMLGVQRQVAGIGEVGSTSYKQLAAEIRLLGRELPVPINQLADMYTAAARMEVPREGLRDFTRTVTMMATAFDAVPDEIAESMGKVAKNFKIPVTEIGRLADVINYLDDNAISKAADIIDVLNRTSGMAASVAITDASTAALASTLLTLGERGETAGTAINAIIQKFAAAEKGTKGFRSAMGEIGLSLGSVQAGMQTDAQGTLFKVIEAIQKLPANQRTGVMVELVGMEHADTMAKLVTNTEEWRRQIALANDEAAKGSMEREFQKRTAALSAHWERFKNSLFDFNSEGGSALRTSLVGVMESMGGVLDRVSDWMRANPGLTAALVKIASVAAIIVTGLGALAIAMAAVIGPFAIATLGISMFSAAGLGMVLIGAGIVAAIAAIVVAAYLIYKHWGPIKAWFAGLWEAIKANFNSTVEWFGALPSRFAAFGTQMMQGLVNGITGGLGAAKAAITGVGDNVVGWFKDKLGIRSPSRVFADLGGFTMQGLAQGLQAASGSPLAVVSKAARGLVTAAGIGLAGVAAAGQGGITIDKRPPLGAPGASASAAVSNHYEIHIHAAPGMDERALARAVATELDRRERARDARGRSSLSDRD